MTVIIIITCNTYPQALYTTHFHIKRARKYMIASLYMSRSNLKIHAHIRKTLKNTLHNGMKKIRTITVNIISIIIRICL